MDTKSPITNTQGKQIDALVDLFAAFPILVRMRLDAVT